MNIHYFMRIAKETGCLLVMFHGSKQFSLSISSLSLSLSLSFSPFNPSFSWESTKFCSMFVSTVKKLLVLKSSELSTVQSEFNSLIKTEKCSNYLSWPVMGCNLFFFSFWR